MTRSTSDVTVCTPAHTAKKGYKSDKCWTEFALLRPGGSNRDRSASREDTPHPKQEMPKEKKAHGSLSQNSFRDSSVERSEPDKTKRRSQTYTVPPGGDSTALSMSSISLGWLPKKLFPSRFEDRKLRRVRAMRRVSEDPDRDYFSCFNDLFQGQVFTKYGFEPLCKQSTAVSEAFSFQQRVRRLLKVGRVNSLHRDSRMRGRILCFSSNRVEKFIADTGTSVTSILKMVAERNRVKCRSGSLLMTTNSIIRASRG